MYTAYMLLKNHHKINEKRKKKIAKKTNKISIKNWIARKSGKSSSGEWDTTTNEDMCTDSALIKGYYYKFFNSFE